LLDDSDMIRALSGHIPDITGNTIGAASLASPALGRDIMKTAGRLEVQHSTVSEAKAYALERTIYLHPGFLIRRLQEIAVLIFLEETAQCDLTPLQCRVLAAVRTHSGLDQSSVCEKIGLDRLERKGLLRRRRLTSSPAAEAVHRRQE
jgi:hypothetical protein